MTWDASSGWIACLRTRMLVPILEEVRNLIGPRRRLTLVFDRGGWSPKLFQKLLSMGFDLMTYRKGRR